MSAYARVGGAGRGCWEREWETETGCAWVCVWEGERGDVGGGGAAGKRRGREVER